MRTALVLSFLLAFAVAAPALAAEHGATEGAQAEKSDGGEKKADKKKDSKFGANYVMIEPLYASILDGNRPQGLLMVGIGLDVPNPELRDRIDQMMPRLRDGYVRSLTVFSISSVRSYRQPDVALMADRLQSVTDKVLAKKGAHVLLAQVMLRLNK